VRETAQRLGLGGWVRNCSDGSVELVADGPPDARDALLAAVHRGPPGAQVVRVEPLPPRDSDPPVVTPFHVVR